jgi:predicted phosphodiesterase
MIQWSKQPKLYSTLLEWDSKGYTQGLMAKRLAAEFPEVFPYVPTRDMIKNALARAKESASYIADSPKAVPTPYIEKYIQQLKGDDIVEKNASILSEILAKPVRKILVISDLHIPFVDEEKFQKVIDQNRTADICLIAGDFLDGYSLSRWRLDSDLPFQHELDNGIRYLEYISKVFPWTRVIRGNHDERAVKKIRDLIPPSLLFLVDQDPLAYITRPFENIEYEDSWWTVLGDALIAHQERSSTYEGRPAVLLQDFFRNKGWHTRLDLPQINVYITGHTHQVSTVYKEGLKMMETGCLANVMKYALDSHAFMRPPMNGYVNLVQENGITNWNESREWII